MSDAGCLRYDLDQERLIVVRGPEQHEVQVRAQVHRLVRYMVERNAASGGTPALCTHDELMEAVWGDEPMHSRTELARLVWELRKQLDAVGTANLIENERRRGYRLRTCPPTDDGDPAQYGDAHVLVTPAPLPRLRRRGLRLLGALSAVAVLGVAAAVVLATRSGGTPTTTADNVAVPTFLDRIENVLVQSAAGRREIRAALRAGLACDITPDEAARRISSVADNRQSVLQQLGTLQTPTAEAARIVTLLQRALQQSIEADRHYRDGFLGTQAGSACPIPTNSGFRLAARSDALATSAKGRFVAAFNPLAERFDRRTWDAGGY